MVVIWSFSISIREYMIEGRWNSEWLPNSRCSLCGKVSWRPSTMLICASMRWSLQVWFRILTTQRLCERSDQAFTLPIMARVLKAKIRFGLTRLLLLCFMESWRPFKPRFCRKCGSPIFCQWHVIECTSLVQTLSAGRSPSAIAIPSGILTSIWEFIPLPELNHWKIHPCYPNSAFPPSSHNYTFK